MYTMKWNWRWILAIKCLYLGNRRLSTIWVLFLWFSWNILCKGSFNFFCQMAFERILVLLAVFILGMTTVSSREVRSLNENTENTFRCKFTNIYIYIFWLHLSYINSRVEVILLEWYAIETKFIEEIHAVKYLRRVRSWFQKGKNIKRGDF